MRVDALVFPFLSPLSSSSLPLLREEDDSSSPLSSARFLSRSRKGERKGKMVLVAPLVVSRRS
ncbi:MAG: hypothetical protein J7L64_01900 [Acidobacteria bacterium]|nr:hypothetical protein [Acidobacteriota bacterium]